MRDLRAVTLPQPHASLVAAGVQTIVTLPRPTDWRGDLLIHAGSGRPDPAWEGGDWAVAAEWDYDGRACRWRRNDFAYRRILSDRIPLPLGAVVAVARVTDCVPIVDMVGDPPHSADPWGRWPAQLVVNHWPGQPLAQRRSSLFLHPSMTFHEDWRPPSNLSDQYPYADFTPGRHALLLDDVRPAHVPDVKGRPGVWTPDPDLTRRVEDAT